MTTYPIRFSADSSSRAGTRTVWESTTAQGNVTVAIPPEFSGPGGGFSPEDLYCLAASNCFVATFKVIAENSRLVYEQLRCEVEATIDKDEHGKPGLRELRFDVTVAGATDEAKTKRLLDKTASSCIVLNALTPEKFFQFVINVT